MKRRLLVVAIAITLSALTGRADTKDKLLHATLVQELGGELKTSFETDTPKIYALWTGDAIKVGDKVRGVWIADDVGDVAPKNSKIDEATVTADKANAEGNFSLSKPDKGWPAGKYRLELYVGDKLAQTLKFTIGDEDDESKSD